MNAQIFYYTEYPGDVAPVYRVVKRRPLRGFITRYKVLISKHHPLTKGGVRKIETTVVYAFTYRGAERVRKLAREDDPSLLTDIFDRWFDRQ